MAGARALTQNISAQQGWRSVDSFVDEIQRRFAAPLGRVNITVGSSPLMEARWPERHLASSDLLHHYWPKLLRSYGRGWHGSTVRGAAARDDADEFRLRGREKVESERAFTPANHGRVAGVN